MKHHRTWAATRASARSTRAVIRVAVAVASVCAALGAAAINPPASAAAAASSPTTAVTLPGLERRTGTAVTTTGDSVSANAFCPRGKWVVGGGASISGGQGRVALTTLNPIFSRDVDNLDSYFVQAMRMDDSTGSWSLRAFALCAVLGNPLQFGRYSSPVEPPSSAPFQHAEAVCPQGMRALSAGGYIFADSTAQPLRVGLQLIRTSGPRDIARATARAAAGFTGPRYLRAIVMCGPVDPAGTAPTVGTVVSGTDAVTTCPTATKTHGAGGGGSTTDSGLTWLDGIVPSEDLRRVSASMTTAPTAGMVASAVCT
jgi:hypothetical protein